MSMTENSLFSIVNDITTKFDGRGDSVFVETERL